MNILENKIVADFTSNGNPVVICEFNEELTKQAILEHQTKLLMFDEFHNQISELLTNPNIDNVVEVCKNLLVIERKYNFEMYKARKLKD